MRGLYGVASVSGLGDAISDQQSIVNSLQDQISTLTRQLNNPPVKKDKKGRIINPTDAQITAWNNTLSPKIDILTIKLNDAGARLDKLSAEKAATPGAQIKAARDYVDQQLLYARIAAGPQSDMGRGSSRRNEYYRGLGASMDRLYALDDSKRGNTGLGVDLWSVIAQGAVKGAQDYARSSDKGLPSFNIPAVSGKPSLPSWLTKPFGAVGGGIVKSIKDAQNQKPAASGAATGIRRPIASGGGFSWGKAAVAVLVLGGAAWGVKKLA